MPLALPILRPLLGASAGEWLLRAGLSNALAATALAVVIAGLCRIGPVRRRPAVVHGLWLLVLLKLLVPPVWSVSLHTPEPPAVAGVTEAAASVTPSDGVTAETMLLPEVEADVVVADTNYVVEAAPEEPEAAAPPPAPAVARFDRIKRLAEQCRRAAPFAAFAWAAGTVACLALAGVRIFRFRRILRHATAAPHDVQARTATLAAEMGLSARVCPAVWFVPGAVSPMLWALPRWLGGPRGPRLLLPLALWEHLDARQRDAILLHELAHLRRRDHWVRLLELAVTAVWWWHPVAWWARRRLREAEEQCCDAWVVWARPASVRHYATALLEALDFAAASIFPGDNNNDRQRTTPAFPAVPALASGMAEFHELKRRLVMIKQGSSTAPLRKLSWAGLSGVCGVAALLLPVVPTVGLAQVVEDKKPEAIQVEVTETVTNEGASAREEGKKPLRIETEVAEEKKIEPGATAEQANAVIVEQNADGKVTRKIQVAPGKKGPGDQPTLYVKRIADSELAKAKAEVEQLRAQLKKAEYQLAMLQAHAGVPDFKVDGKEWYDRKADGKASVGWSTGKGPAVSVKAPAKQSVLDDQREARLQKLEESLSVLLKEVKSLRDEGSARPTEKITEKIKSKPQAEDDFGDSTPKK